NLTSIRCSAGCPVGSECDQVSGYCQCTFAYPVLAEGRKMCSKSQLKQLHQECLYSSECSHIENAECLKSYNPLDQIKKCRCPRGYIAKTKHNQTRCVNLENFYKSLLNNHATITPHNDTNN